MMIIFLVCLFCILSQLEVRADDRVDQLSQSELEFGLSLFKRVSNSEKNTVLSPTSVYDTLLTIYVASAGETDEGLQRLLGIDNISPKLDKSKLLDAILSDNKNTSSLKELDVYNRIYIDKEVKVKQEMKQRFDELLAIFETEDNRADEVNKWISSKTHGFIKELLEQGSLTKDDRLVFVNAAYLKKNWTVPFIGRTSVKPFTLNDGSVVQVPQMYQNGNVFQSMVHKGLGAQVIKLPYREVPMSMVIMVPTTPPNTGSSPLHGLVSQLDGHKITELMSTLQKQPFCATDLLVPKFESESTFELKKVLTLLSGGDVIGKEMNLTNLFEPDQLPTKVGKVVQKVRVKVYENGTEAAAATAVSINTGPRVLPFCYKTFHADRPFLYFIYDEEHKAIHFIGTLNHPNNIN